MNSTGAVIGGIIVLVLIAGGIFYMTREDDPNQTVTPSSPVSAADPSAPQTAGVPQAVTSNSAVPTDTTVVVSGTVTPNGAFTTYWYEYGTTATLGSKTQNQSVGSGFIAINAPAYITGLTKSTNYFYRIVAENQFGTVAGTQQLFKTTDGVPAPVGNVPTAKTLAASNVARTTATVNGEVTPNRAQTQYWFEYGKTPNLGQTTGFTSVGNGSGKMNVAVSFTDLTPSTTYHFRLNAQNQFGTVNGATLSFNTDGSAAVTPTAAPSATTRAAGTIEKTSATLHGTIAPNGLETQFWFEYSTDSLLGSALLKATNKQSAGAGMSPVTVERATDVTGLKAGTKYYFRVVAENSKGVTRGERQDFQTKP